MAKKLTYEEVKQAFFSRGYTLVSTEYINNNTKLNYICPHHKDKQLSISYRKLKEGVGCRYCASEKRGEKQRIHTIEKIKEEFAAKQYTLLANEYINPETKMDYICPIHPNEKNSINYSNFKKGHGCVYCARETTKNKQKHSIEFVRKEFENRGYVLLENQYINNKTPMKFQCAKHPNEELYISYADFLKVQGCKYCGYQSMADQRRLPFEKVKKAFEDKGLILLDGKYKDNNTKMKYKCPKHPDKEQYITYGNLFAGQGCPMCSRENLRGENNHLWKGGVSELNNYLRQYLDSWKLKSFKKYDYTCFVTGQRGTNLEIHHVKPFNIIRDNVLKGLNVPTYQYIKDYDQQTLNKIVDMFLKEHDKHLGIPLKKDIHKLFHNKYGWDDVVSFNDLLEFKELYSNTIK